MIKRIFLFVIIILLAGSCKKPCYECNNICYSCPALTTDIQCSTDYQNKLFFNLAINAIEQSGINCYKIGPTITFEECEEEKIEIFNNEEYECIKK